MIWYAIPLLAVLTGISVIVVLLSKERDAKFLREIGAVVDLNEVCDPDCPVCKEGLCHWPNASIPNAFEELRTSYPGIPIEKEEKPEVINPTNDYEIRIGFSLSGEPYLTMEEGDEITRFSVETARKLYEDLEKALEMIDGLSTFAYAVAGGQGDEFVESVSDALDTVLTQTVPIEYKMITGGARLYHSVLQVCGIGEMSLVRAETAQLIHTADGEPVYPAETPDGRASLRGYEEDMIVRTISGNLLVSDDLPHGTKIVIRKLGRDENRCDQYEFHVSSRNMEWALRHYGLADSTATLNDAPF